MRRSRGTGRRNSDKASTEAAGLGDDADDAESPTADPCAASTASSAAPTPLDVGETAALGQHDARDRGAGNAGEIGGESGDVERVDADPAARARTGAPARARPP